MCTSQISSMRVNIYICGNERQNISKTHTHTHTHTKRYIVLETSRRGNREGVSSGGRCTKVERGGRKAEVSLFPPYFGFEIEPKCGDTRERVISSRFDSIMKWGRRGRGLFAYIRKESRLDFVVCKVSHPE